MTEDQGVKPAPNVHICMQWNVSQVVPKTGGLVSQGLCNPAFSSAAWDVCFSTWWKSWTVVPRRLQLQLSLVLSEKRPRFTWQLFFWEAETAPFQHWGNSMDMPYLDLLNMFSANCQQIETINLASCCLLHSSTSTQPHQQAAASHAVVGPAPEDQDAYYYYTVLNWSVQPADIEIQPRTKSSIWYVRMAGSGTTIVCRSSVLVWEISTDWWYVWLIPHRWNDQQWQENFEMRDHSPENLCRASPRAAEVTSPALNHQH